MSGNGWVEVIITASIFVPVIITAWITVLFLRGKNSDPDEQRLKRTQAEYEARRDRQESRRP
jgi:hypothetical protein